MSHLQEVLAETCSVQGTAETPPLEAKKRKSMRRAINEYCRECIWDSLMPGNWKQQTGACTMTTCPLYEFRPVSKPRKAGVVTEGDFLEELGDEELEDE